MNTVQNRHEYRVVRPQGLHALGVRQEGSEYMDLTQVCTGPVIILEAHSPPGEHHVRVRCGHGRLFDVPRSWLEAIGG